MSDRISGFNIYMKLKKIRKQVMFVALINV
jgi:hypothetical protein